jgi:uncharacterized membrane protein YoaK (UPF0700 family)
MPIMVRELDTRRMLTAATLSAVAGWVDAVAFIAVGGYFVSFMSGNTTRGAVDTAQGGAWWIALGLVAAFLAGVMVASVAQRLAPGRPETATVAVSAILLAAAAGSATVVTVVVTAVLLAAAMGAVNVTFTRDRAVSFGVTYMTGALVKAAQGAIGRLWGERHTGWWRYLVLWAAIAAGAVGGSLAYPALGLGAVWIALGALLAVLAVTLLRRV